MTLRHERTIAIGLVALAFAIRAGFAFTLPVFQAPDERAHFDVVRTLVAHHGLPVQPRLTPEEALRNWPQAYQPPLAYLSFAPVAALTRAAGLGAGEQLRWLRLQNALYGALLVGVVFGIARHLRPRGDPLRLLAPLAVATLPGLAANSASLNNDALANLLAAAFWWAWLSEPPGTRRALATGVVFGAACVTKLTAATLAPLLLLLPWLAERRFAPALREAMIASGVALLLLAPWMARNVALYGDPLAVGIGSFAFERLEGVLPEPWLADARTPAPGKVAAQWVGRFGITNNLSWWPVTLVWGLLVTVAAGGWLRGSAAAGDARDRALRLAFLAATACAAFGLVSFSLRYYGAWQGRYLYVCAAPMLWLLCEGGARWIPARRATAVLVALALLGLALDAALLLRLGAFFAEAARESWGLRTAL